MLGADEDFWLKVGIDPIRMITRGGTFYTLALLSGRRGGVPRPQRPGQRLRV